MLKKIGIVFACFLLIFVVAAIALPLLVNVDNYRPQIEAAVNDQINGELKLGKLSLSLWGGLEVKIESIALTGAGDKRPLIEANSAYVAIPFLSLLTGSPRLNAVLDKPTIRWVRDKKGETNVLALIPDKKADKSKVSPADKKKNQVADAPKAESPGNNAATSSAETPVVPGFVANAALGFKILNGQVSVTDQQAGGNYAINGVELSVQNLGLRETISLELILPVQGKSAQIDLDGILRASGQLTPILKDNEVRSASGRMNLDFSDLAVRAAGGAFQKTKSMPLTFDLQFKGSESDLVIESLKLIAHKLELNGKGVLTVKPNMAINFSLQSSSLELSSLQELLPMLKQYELKGVASTAIKIAGPTDKLSIDGSLNVKSGSASYSEVLQKPVNFALALGFTEDSLSVQSVTLEGPETDLKLVGNVKNFAAPRFNFQLNGKKVNLDKLLKPTSSTKSAQLWQQDSLQAIANVLVPEATAAKPSSGDVNPMLELAKNPVVANAAGEFTARLGTLISSGAPITDIEAKVVLKNMQLSIPNASLRTFGGTVKATANANLRAAGLDYATDGKVAGISASEALTTYFARYKNTLTGTLGADWNLKGQAFPPAVRLPSIKGVVNIAANDGSFKTADIQGTITEIMQKVPLLKKNKAPTLDEGFKTLSAKLAFNNGTITADPLNIIQRGRGFDLRGKSVIDPNLNQDTYVDVYDPNNLLPDSISEGAKGPALSLHITGSLSDPKPDYGYTVSRVAKKLVQSEGKKAISKGLGSLLGGSGAKASDGGDSGGTKSPGDAVKDALKKKFKLF